MLQYAAQLVLYGLKFMPLEIELELFLLKFE